LAKLHLDSLIGKRSVKALREALGKLATGLGAYDSAYTSAMERIESQVPDQVELAKQVIAWIVHAKRRITTTELREALGVEVGERDIDRDNCPDIDDMVSACAGLVTIDAGSRVIRLVHYTTQEYFERTKRTLFPDAEAMMALQCMTYLSFDCWDQKNTETARRGYLKYVLCRYAARYWGIHAKLAPAALPHVMDFLRRPRHVAKSRLLGRHEFGIHASAVFGLNEAARVLLEETIDTGPDTENCEGSTPLMFAAFGGHESVVKLFLERNAAVNKTNNDGYTPLYLAIISGHNTVVKLLLDWHADVHGQPRSESLLQLAMTRGDEDVIRLLLEAGVDVEFENGLGETPLQIATRQGSTAVFKLLLDAGASINHQGRLGSSPLHVACLWQRVEVVRLLVDAGAALDLLNHTRESPLEIVCAQGNQAIVKLLLDAGAVVNRETIGPSPLHRASLSGHELIVELLLKSGAEVDRKDHMGDHPLHSACENGHHTVVKLLLSAGAQVKHQNKDGASPLHLACHHGHYAIVRLLLDAGAEIECENKDNRTPLFLAGWSYHSGVAIVRDLLNSGANIYHKDKEGQMPLYFACKYNRRDVITYLLKAGADINCQDNQGRTPLFHACTYSSGAAVQKLLEAGADMLLKDNTGRTAFDVIYGGDHSTIIKCVWPHNGTRVKVEITPPSPVFEKASDPDLGMSND
jgi:ankyrin repeat protein